MFQIINMALRKRWQINKFPAHENNNNMKNIYTCYEKKNFFLTLF